MNILFICSAKSWGGNEKWTSMAMQGLMQQHQVYFLGKNTELLSNFGEVTASYSAPFKWNFDFETKSIIAQIVQDHHIEVIVSTKKKEYFLAGLVARKLNVKHFLRLGIVRDMKFPFWSKLLYYTLNDGIIVNAHKIKKNLLKYAYFNDHPIEVIFNGVPAFHLPQSISIENDTFIIVSTGMLTQRKGFHILIEAISLLPDDLKKNLELHIVGEGREESMLKQLVKDLNLEANVFFDGFSHEPTKFLSRANLFALISGNEGISNAIIEAMYAGVPVLTTNAGGASEFIKHQENGYLAVRKAEDVSGILKEILLMNKKDLAWIGQKGQITAKSLFNVERMNDQLASFILRR